VSQTIDIAKATLVGEAIEIEPVNERSSFNGTFLEKYFEAAIKFESSDLLMRGGQTPKLRLRGALKNLDVPPLDEIEFEKAIEKGLNAHQWQIYSHTGSCDIGYDFDERNRFRVNVFRTRGRSAIAARRVSDEILNFKDLHLPEVCGRIADVAQGLILLCGVTGSGKSTTIASMLQYINERKAVHIVTIEDPVEYMFADAKALINQREIGIDVPNFATGLRALVRENPDVILIGEMRDKETFEAAIQAAETGHLVFGTIHASSAAQAFGRIYDLFPPDERENIRNMLAFQMQAFMYQKLLPTLHKDPPRIPAVEILLQSPATRKFIIEGRESELDEVIKQNREAGMQSFTDSLIQLVNDNWIHPKVAQTNALNPEEVKMRLRGISS
jgi:twitching motility protein PilT